MAFPARALAVVAILMLALAPAAQGKPQPVLYFLKDHEVAPGHRVPVGDGDLSTLPPPPAPNPQDPTNATAEPFTRTVFPFTSAVAPTQFVANASANTGRIAGVLPVLLLLPKTPAMQSAILNVSLVALPKDPEVPPPLGGGGTLLAWARVPLDYQNQTLPNATAFVPQNTTDPQAAINYTTGQLASYGLTTVFSWFTFAFLDDAVKDYFVDVTVDPASRLALRFVLENGTAYSPAPGVPPQQVPIPVGAGQEIVYDFALAPSYVYVPWYAPDPPVTTTSTTRTTTTTTSTTSGQATTTTTSSEPSPVLPFGLLVLAAIGAAWSVRRRL